MSDFFQSIECEKCGSNEINFLEKGVYECAHCGAKIITRGKNEKDEIEQIFLALDERCSIEEFKRNAYIELYSKVDTPVNIDDCNFGEPYVEYTHYGVVTANHTLNYSVDIGHDRTEQYVAYETKYSNGKSYKERVIKERTVTDWTPISGTYSEREWGVIKLDSHNKQNISDSYVTIEGFNFENYLDTAWDEGVIKKYEACDYDEDPLMLSEDDIDDTIDAAAEKVAWSCECGLPGDSNKNFNYSVKSELVKVESISCKEYVLPFEYDGKPYEVKGYCSTSNVRTEFCPKVDAYGEQREKNGKKDDKVAKFGCATTIAISIIGIILGIVLQNIALSVLVPLIAFGLMFAITLISSSIVDNKRGKEEDALKEDYQKRKKEALIKRISKLGLKAPTEKELEKFDNWLRWS